MEGKEVKCTVKFVLEKVLLVAGIIAGAVLAILGIVTITADTSDLFAYPFVMWYVRDEHTVGFTDTKDFSRHDDWLRPNDYLYFEWTSNEFRTIIESNSNWERLSTGLKSETLKAGKILFKLDNITLDTHYFCMSNDGGATCDPRSDPSNNYRLTLHMYKGTVFYTNGYLGNQNMRFTFFILAAVMVAFGVVMILGELHVPLITTKFTFFYYSFVKGLIYFGTGFLCMGMANLFGLFVAIVMWIVGIANCVHGWRSVATFKWNQIGARGTTTVVTRREYI